MDPLASLTSLIDKTEEWIGHSPHPAIVGVPIGAWAVSNLCDVLALASADHRYDDTARISLGIGLAAAAGAVVTGIRDYGSIPSDRPSHEVATRHALGNAVAGTLLASSYLLRVRDHQAGRSTGGLARALALAGGGLVVYTAWLGGRLVQEFGEGVNPVMDRLAVEESRADFGRDRLHPNTPLGLQQQ